MPTPQGQPPHGDVPRLTLNQYRYEYLTQPVRAALVSASLADEIPFEYRLARCRCGQRDCPGWRIVAQGGPFGEWDEATVPVIEQ